MLMDMNIKFSFFKKKDTIPSQDIMKTNKLTRIYSTTVIAKIKEMPRSLFYVIPCYVTMDYEK